MFAKANTPTTAARSWAAPLAICCLLFMLALIAATIVIALIPIYLSTKDVTVASPNAYNFNTMYASDVDNGRSLTLSDTSGLSNQLESDIPGSQNTLDVESGEFLAATPSNKRKRQATLSTVTCEVATGLTGDIFSAKNNLKIPAMYRTSASQSKYLTKFQNNIRSKHRRKTVTMVFTTETRTVTLAFCGFTQAVITGPGSGTGSSPGITNSTGQCTTETATYIYVVDQLSNFYYVSPTNFNGYIIGKLNCSSTGHPHSLAIQSDGTAWTLYSDGTLYKFNIKDLKCTQTSYLSEQEGIILFGMNFVNDTSTNTEKLYLTTDSSTPPFRLATLDTNTLKISVVRYYDNIVGRGELAGTSDGKLYGLFEGTPFNVAEINKTSANIVSKTPQNSIQSVSDSSYFSIATLKSNFLLSFGNDSSSTDLYIYNPSTKSATKANSVPIVIVGAASSICLQGVTVN